MGCSNSKATENVSVSLQPSTCSQNSKRQVWTNASDSQATEYREDVPSFVVLDSADLVGSSDGEPVHGMMSAFTFSFIQASAPSSNNSNFSLHLDSSFVSEEQTSPGPPESLTFAMTDDPIELQPIPEERSGPRRSDQITTEEALESAATEPEEESAPASDHFIENSAVSDSAMTETSELLMNELVASEISSCTTGDTRRSVSDFSEGGEYIVTETGAVVRQESVVEAVREEYDAVVRESIEAVATAFIKEIVDGALGEIQQIPRDRAALVARSSLQVEPSNTGIFALSIKTQQSRVPIYAVVGITMDKGVVLYKIQRLDEVTDSAEWSTPLSCRYSEFSEMYLKLKESGLPAAQKLPKLSRAGVFHFVRGRQSKKTIEERQQQFAKVLRYIAEHRELHENVVFQSFLARE